MAVGLGFRGFGVTSARERAANSPAGPTPITATLFASPPAVAAQEEGGQHPAMNGCMPAPGNE